MRTITTLFIICLCYTASAQVFDTIGVDRLGIYANIDQAFNFSDGVFIGGTDRKISVGATYAQKDGKHVVFLGGGFRLFKFTFTEPDLTTSFVNDLNDNYVPIEQAGFDSLVGAAMSQGGYFSGSTGAWVHTSFIWINKYRPSITFYFGYRGLPSYGPGFVEYTDPEYHDIEYAQLSTRFYELRLGFSPPFLNKRGWPFNANLNAGFRLTDYKNFTIGDVPMSAYTNSGFSNKHRYTGCFTLSISLSFWSNWIWD